MHNENNSDCPQNHSESFYADCTCRPRGLGPDLLENLVITTVHPGDAKRHLIAMITDDERLNSYQPITDWLFSDGRRDGFHVDAMVDCLLLDIFDRGDAKRLAELAKSIADYLGMSDAIIEDDSRWMI